MLIESQNISKSYRNGNSRVEAVRGCSFSMAVGEFLAITGPSGSGKSTLMAILGLLERPSAGSFQLLGQNTGSMSADDRAKLRNQELGFVFQSYSLLPRLTALENVELPMIYAGVPAAGRRQRARELLRKTGLEDRQNHVPSQLSGGEQQRIAIARALANDPGLILADEPTGALDSEKGQQILSLFQEINAEGRSIAVITHDESVARRAGRILRMNDGQIVADDLVNPFDRPAISSMAQFANHQAGAGASTSNPGPAEAEGGGSDPV